MRGAGYKINFFFPLWKGNDNQLGFHLKPGLDLTSWGFSTSFHCLLKCYFSKELLLAEEWAKKNNIKFPPINANEKYNLYGLKEFYVFSDPSDPTCPVVIHFALANNKFKEQIRPGWF